MDNDLRLDGKNLVFRGENGTGKSSLVDALELFFSNTISHLTGTEGIKIIKHAPHIRFLPHDVNVEITFSPHNEKVTKKLLQPISPPKGLESYFNEIKNRPFILRRHQILEFIVSKPSERYLAIGNIIGINALDPIEKTMSRVHNKYKAKYSITLNQLNSIKSELSRILGEPVSNSLEINPLLNKNLKNIKLPSINLSLNIKKQIEKIYQASLLNSKKSEYSSIQSIKNGVRELFLSKNFGGSTDGLFNKMEKLSLIEMKRSHTLMEFLSSGINLIKDVKGDICPFCEQIISKKDLRNQLRKRIDLYGDLSVEYKSITSTREILQSEVFRKTNLLRELENNLKKLKTKNDLLQKIIQIKNEFLTLERYFKTLENFKKIELRKETLSTLQNIQNNLNAFMNDITLLSKEFALNQDEKNLLEVITEIQQIFDLNTRLTKIEVQEKALKRKYQISEEIFLKFTNVKKNKIQDIHEQISLILDEYYKRLHPDDPHESISLTIIPHRRASTKLEINPFNEGPTDPRALVSEGHLDSLGLCIFLSFTKKFNENIPLLIFDDIVTTIDSQHRRKICQLIYQEFSDQQLLFTTHDELWYTELCQVQSALEISHTFKRMEIIRWDLENGPEIRPYFHDNQKILQKIGEGDKKGAGNLARQYLEWILGNFCENTETAIPYNSVNLRMVNDFFVPALKRIKEKITNEEYKQEIIEIFQEIKMTVFFGNLMSHNNVLAGTISINEISEFCNAVQKLHEKTICPTCRTFLKYYRELKEYRCPKGSCKNKLIIQAR